MGESETVDLLLTEARQRLAAAPFRPKRREALLLLARTLERSEAALLAHPEEVVEPAAAARFRELLRRRLTGEPVAYLFGEREFYGRPFTVDARVLIPRPETEHLVEAALGLELPAAARILDLGTGSGCLAVTLACELAAARVVATDLSPAAVAVARRNAARHGVAERVHLVACDLAAALVLGSFDLVVSNPPYIDRGEAPHLSTEVRDHEPEVALFAPDERLSVFARLAAELGDLPAGAHVAMEIPAGREGEVEGLFSGSPLAWVATIPDYAGIPRVVVTKRR